ncbi:MAG: YjbQ family protein [Rhodospirillales bacterium]|nr:YjbQ family protein [Alphaproteobacteria bacterium]MBL6948327.1 YjbQ family protein [Rhodospirillales bacterium]
MKQAQGTLTVETPGQGLLEVTGEVTQWLRQQSVSTGLLTIYIRHTSASLVIQENADPSVMRDMQGFFKKLVPEDLSLYSHTTEGSDDMPAHIKGALTETSLGIPVSGGEMVLGTWQGIFLFEHRTRPHRRELVLHLIGDNPKHNVDEWGGE